MARGIGVVSGSSIVLFQSTDDGAHIIGRDQAVTIQMSGTLNLRVPGATSGPTNSKWLRLTGSDGYAIWSAMSASLITSVPLGNITSSNVQGALNELQDHINQVSAGGGSYTFSDGVNSNNITTSGQTVTLTGSTSQIVSTWNTNKWTISFAPNIFLTGSVVTIGPLTASNGISILAGGLSVGAGGGSTTLQALTAGPITASNGVNVSTGGLNVQAGSTTLQATSIGPLTASNGVLVPGGAGSSTFQTITVGPLTASNGIVVSANGITVNAGASTFQTVVLSTLTSSANVYAQTMTITGSTTLGTSGSQVNTTIVNGLFQVPIFTAGNVPSVYVNDPFKYVGYMFYLQGAGSGTFAQGNKWYHNENGIWFPSMFFGA